MYPVPASSRKPRTRKRMANAAGVVEPRLKQSKLEHPNNSNAQPSTQSKTTEEIIGGLQPSFATDTISWPEVYTIPNNHDGPVTMDPNDNAAPPGSQTREPTSIDGTFNTEQSVIVGTSQHMGTYGLDISGELLYAPPIYQIMNYPPPFSGPSGIYLDPTPFLDILSFFNHFW